MLWKIFIKSGDKVKLKDEIKDTHYIPDALINDLKGKILTVKDSNGNDSVYLEEGLGFNWVNDMLEPVSNEFSEGIRIPNTTIIPDEITTPEKILTEMEQEVIEIEEIAEDVQKLIAKKQSEIDCLKAQIEVYKEIIDRFFIHTDMTSVINHFKEDKDE